MRAAVGQASAIDQDCGCPNSKFATAPITSTNTARINNTPKMELSTARTLDNKGRKSNSRLVYLARGGCEREVGSRSGVDVAAS